MELNVQFNSAVSSSLTQSAEMIFGAVHHVEVESTCQADSVQVIVLV